LDSLSSEDVVVPGIYGTVNPVSAVEVEVEAITVAEKASSLTMLQDRLEDGAGAAPRRHGSQRESATRPTVQRWRSKSCTLSIADKRRMHQ
jgi:hypothetical protein